VPKAAAAATTRVTVGSTPEELPATSTTRNTTIPEISFQRGRGIMATLICDSHDYALEVVAEPGLRSAGRSRSQ